MKALLLLPAVFLLVSLPLALSKPSPIETPLYSIHEAVSYRTISPIDIPIHIRFPKFLSLRGTQLDKSDIPSNPGVYMCDGLNFTGRCIYVRPESGVCCKSNPPLQPKPTSGKEFS